MKHRVVYFKKDNRRRFLIVKEEQLEILPSKYLKHLDRLNASPNTVHLAASSLAYYYDFLFKRDMKLEEVEMLSYAEQNKHFIDFLNWVKSGMHTEKKTITSNKTCNMYLRCIFKFYQFLAQEEILPWLKIVEVKQATYFDEIGVKHHRTIKTFPGFFKEEKKRIEELTTTDIQKLIHACTNERDRLLIAMLAETGFRIGEILGIYYTEDIDFERKTVRVYFRENNKNQARAKNAEYREARLSDTTFDFLMKYLSDFRTVLSNTEYLFTKLTGKEKGQPLEANSVYSLFKRLGKKTEIYAHPHQLRHYFAEERRKNGWDLNSIRVALGHKKIETTIKYLGENSEQLIDATEQYFLENKDLYELDDFL